MLVADLDNLLIDEVGVMSGTASVSLRLTVPGRTYRQKCPLNPLDAKRGIRPTLGA